MELDCYEQHRQLCDSIINKQRQLLADPQQLQPHDSKKLDDLIELWQRETSELKRNYILPAIEQPKVRARS